MITCHPRGTCFHTMAPLKLRDVHFMYTYIYTQSKKERHIIHDSNEKNQVIYEEQFSVKLIGFHDVTLGIMFTTDR